jgi:hypothetical protein
MKSLGSGLLPILLGLLLVIAVTAVQGVLTDRWDPGNVAEDLARAAAVLEKNFPDDFGDWKLAQELEGDPKQLERAGAVGHISRVYRNTRSGATVSAFVVCATPHNASGHTPDRCYPGAGFRIAEAEHRQSVPLVDGRTAETFTGTFAKQGQTLRVYWTYGVDGEWIAPQIARIELAGKRAVNKLYAIVDETGIRDGRAQKLGIKFLSELLPAFDERVTLAARAEAAAQPASPTAVDAATKPAG